MLDRIPGAEPRVEVLQCAVSVRVEDDELVELLLVEELAVFLHQGFE